MVPFAARLGRRHVGRRILPEAKPRNPRLADVLGLFDRWEGRGNGMALLVNLALQNEIDLPYYRMYQEDVRLVICAGKLFDSAMESLLNSFDAYLTEKLGGTPISLTQKLVLAYIIKSERANRHERHTILLTPDNNHFTEIESLELAGLITKHPSSPPLFPIYIADRELMK